MRIVPGDGVTQQRVSQPVHLDRVHDMEVYDATAASRYDVTDVVLREEVVGGEGADDRLAEPIHELERAILTTYWPLGFDGVKGDMTRSGKVECSLDCGMFDDGCDDGDGDGDAKM
ncbi:hypothetical protein HBH70_101910 [Parastagonospora nodorum]|nr:hypothetical protein HBI10_226390 [Parastagonospora nodorum]KAH4009366.1 hypothetical protein HBI13_221110 [Parastagonospora nodorum]KAH4043288.1 hypothetical protein HBH49_235390 [Parastagonospora nodorum]KAH4063950.1 hypothetical protein HBH50_180270 [Parastagonospora nodorum]KAH4087332.1 hypothetical protein HBH48_130590 [Parastagonospora nodorum]